MVKDLETIASWYCLQAVGLGLDIPISAQDTAPVEALHLANELGEWENIGTVLLEEITRPLARYLALHLVSGMLFGYPFPS